MSIEQPKSALFEVVKSLILEMQLASCAFENNNEEGKEKFFFDISQVSKILHQLSSDLALQEFNVRKVNSRHVPKKKNYYTPW